MFGDDDFGHTWLLARFFGVVLVAVNEHDDVGILLDGTRLSQVAHHGAFVGALLYTSVELRQGNHRALQLTGQHLQTPRNFTQFSGPVFAVVGCATHQLEVVHHNQAQLSALARQATRVGAKFTGGEARTFVNVKRNIAQFLNGFRQPWPFFIGQFASAQMPLVNAANRADDTYSKLRRTHLHREDGHRQAFIQSHMFCNIDGQCGLAHGRACCKNDQIPRLQASGHAVQVIKPGGHTRHIIGVVSHLLHAVQQLNHQRVHPLKTLLVARALLPNIEDLLLGLVHDG